MRDLSFVSTIIRGRCFLCLVLLSWPSSSAFASFDTLKGARALGMAGAFVAQADNADALYYNPAGLWQTGQVIGQAFYSAPFNLQDLGTTSFGLVFPFGGASAGTSLESYGFDLYRETTVGISCAYAFRQKFAVGLTGHYYHLAIRSGGTSATAGLDGGVLFRPHARVQIGVVARNVTRPRMAGEALPQVMVFGSSFQPLDHLTVNLDVYKDVRFPADVRTGVEYCPHPVLMLRMGIGREPSRLAAGFGVDFKFGRLEYAILTHPDLGVTHAVSASVTLGRRTSRALDLALQE